MNMKSMRMDKYYGEVEPRHVRAEGITIDDQVKYLVQLAREAVDKIGVDIDTLLVHRELYKSFPSYRKDSTVNPRYDEMMDTKRLKCLLGTKDVVESQIGYKPNNWFYL